MDLRAWRRARDITQKEMAEKLAVHVSTYQNWERCPRNIAIDDAVKISKILGVSMNEIFFGENK